MKTQTQQIQLKVLNVVLLLSLGKKKSITNGQCCLQTRIMLLRFMITLLNESNNF